MNSDYMPRCVRVSNANTLKFSALILEYFVLYFNIVLIFMAKGHINAAWSQMYRRQTASRI